MCVCMCVGDGGNGAYYFFVDYHYSSNWNNELT